ncbi:MAG TPA: hypothetical protein VNZ43_14250 [Sphingomonadaceae bacterium]|nr:hypothetical protein [Sphingomonadaceae bacterium]
MMRPPMIACLALLLPLCACGGHDSMPADNSAEAFENRAAELEAAAENDSRAAQQQAIAAYAAAQNATATPPDLTKITPVDRAR